MGMRKSKVKIEVTSERIAVSNAFSKLYGSQIILWQPKI
jgi:hypothetical protein